MKKQEIINLYILVDKNTTTPDRFDFLWDCKNIKTLFNQKHFKNIVNMYAKNDRILNRTTVLGIDYGDGCGYSRFSLIPM